MCRTRMCPVLNVSSYICQALIHRFLLRMQLYITKLDEHTELAHCQSFFSRLFLIIVLFEKIWRGHHMTLNGLLMVR
jgi:hypothetical protein